MAVTFAPGPAGPPPGSVSGADARRGAREAAARTAERAMTDAIVVIDAGSSSLKFSRLAMRAGDLALEVHGQFEGLYTAPKFAAADASGRPVPAGSWGEDAALGHQAAAERLRGFLRDRLAHARLVGMGHRV
jgi:acetate kinase